MNHIISENIAGLSKKESKKSNGEKSVNERHRE